MLVMAGEEAATSMDVVDQLQASTEGMKTVLAVFMNRRRPVCFQGSEDPKTEKQNLLDAVKTTFSDVISSGEGTSGAGVGGYFLQTESEEWGGLVDVTGQVQDRATVLLQSCSSDPRKAQVLKIA